MQVNAYFIKAALIRAPGYPVGTSAPLVIACRCGGMPHRNDREPIVCACGTVYDRNGWILNLETTQ